MGKSSKEVTANDAVAEDANPADDDAAHVKYER